MRQWLHNLWYGKTVPGQHDEWCGTGIRGWWRKKKLKKIKSKIIGSFKYPLVSTDWVITQAGYGPNGYYEVHSMLGRHLVDPKYKQNGYDCEFYTGEPTYNGMKFLPQKSSPPVVECVSDQCTTHHIVMTQEIFFAYHQWRSGFCPKHIRLQKLEEWITRNEDRIITHGIEAPPYDKAE